MTRKTIYFVCTGNSARSQMAEGFAREYLDFDEWNVRSGGVEQDGLHPLAVQVMSEVGIDIGNQHSDLVDLEVINHSYLVVTLCGNARDRFPEISQDVRVEDWTFQDPEKAEVTDEEKIDAFRLVRDMIDLRVKEFVEAEA